jgi:peptide/nickel transport system substrate-binding protein
VERDTAEADRLLDAAGWRRGADGGRVRAGRLLDVELLTVGSGDNVAEQLVQADLGARGIRVRVRQTEMGSFLTTARATDKRFDLLLAGIPGDLALSYVGALFSTAQRGGTFDYTGYHSAALDALLANAADAATPEQARLDWGEVQSALDTLAPATWLFHARGLQGVTRRLQGVHIDLRGELATVHDWTLGPSSGAAR